MSYEKVLTQNHISGADVNLVAEAFLTRAQTQAAAGGAKAHPLAVYHTAAVDMAMGAVDLHKEVQAGMQGSHSARAWLSILAGVPLADLSG